MRATFRPLPAWPYEPQEERQAQYTTTYEDTLAELDRELVALGASEIVIGLVMDEGDVRLDGMLRATARPRYPGVELSFDTPDKGRLTFHTDRHRGYLTRQAWVPARQRGRDEGLYRTIAAWHDNLRALALGLEALRAVDRYGITQTGQQYAGFRALEAGPVERGRRLVEEAGSVESALKRHHPDHGGHERALQDVLAYRKAVRA